MMEDQPEEAIREMARNFEARWGERRKRIAERSTRAREEAMRLTKRFRQRDPELRQVVLFGSLAHGGVSAHERFDIDLAVESDHYLALVGEALDSEFDINVVDLRNVWKAILEEIETFGEVLYERR